MTTIWLEDTTKAQLDALKIHPREPYDEVVRRLLEELKALKAEAT